MFPFIFLFPYRRANLVLACTCGGAVPDVRNDPHPIRIPCDGSLVRIDSVLRVHVNQRIPVKLWELATSRETLYTPQGVSRVERFPVPQDIPVVKETVAYAKLLHLSPP